MGGSGGGLEMKFHQNAYSTSPYFDTWEDGVRVPVVQAWSSNIPCPYLDTRQGNPLEERSWTIGSNGDQGCRQLWGSGRWYNTYVRAYPGNGLSGSSKAFPTHEQCPNPSFGTCDTWQMFQDDYCPVGFWDTPNPVSSWHWTRLNGDGGGQAGCP